MKSPTIEYKLKVWAFLEEMKPGKMYSIDKLAKIAHREAFCESVKEYMRSFAFNGFITFNHDFTKIYRENPFVEKKYKPI